MFTMQGTRMELTRMELYYCRQLDAKARSEPKTVGPGSGISVLGRKRELPSMR